MLEREQCCDLEIIRTARAVGEQPFVQMFSASFAVASYRPALTASEQTHRSGSKKTAGAESPLPRPLGPVLSDLRESAAERQRDPGPTEYDRRLGLRSRVGLRLVDPRRALDTDRTTGTAVPVGQVYAFTRTRGMRARNLVDAIGTNRPARATVGLRGNCANRGKRGHNDDGGCKIFSGIEQIQIHDSAPLFETARQLTVEHLLHSCAEYAAAARGY